MKSIAIFMLGVALAVWAQTPSPLSPQTVVAIADGKPITANDLMTVYRMSPPEAQKNLLKDGKMFVESYGLIRKLAEMAEKAHLDEQSPLKDQLLVSRRQFLAGAQAAAARDSLSTTIQAADQKKFYDDHLDRYTQAKVKVLFVSFKANPARKALSEPEAKAKVEKLLVQIRAGADFVKLVKEHSEDAESVARDGDFGPMIKGSDENLPQNIRNAIFALNAGQVTEPLRVPTGFYLFRIEEIAKQSYDAVRDDIFIEIQQKRFDEWREKIQKSLDVKIVNEDFFTKTAASAVTTK
jgi:parvulin-like peptidyl-prolyl isomerase